MPLRDERVPPRLPLAEEHLRLVLLAPEPVLRDPRKRLADQPRAIRGESDLPARVQSTSRMLSYRGAPD